ncbi:MAG: hypothetical protein K9N49_10200, partial [Candidatus Marinimicrobia bacterium]|nr:hypothetical protein [Candidatus Neomarinimicrobiota bacterium]
MICQRCHEREATLHLTTVTDGEVQKLHLCETCADKAGFTVEGPVSVSDLLLGLAGGALAAGDPAPAPKPPLKRAVPACPECGLTLAQFKKRSRLGCPACYEAF